MKHSFKVFVLVGVIGAAATFASQVSNKQYSASLSNVSVTLSNSRLSFRGALASGNSVGSTVAYINTTRNAYPSTASSQLVEGDVGGDGDKVMIGNAGSMSLFSVDDSYNNTTVPFEAENKIYLSAGLGSGQADAGDDVIATSSSVLTVKMTTTNAIANGRFRVLVPALTNNGAAGDGIPDGGYFDFGTTTPTVTCPGDVGLYVYDFVSGAATNSAVTLTGTLAGDYHAFECAYSGPGATSTAFDGVSNGAITINSLINPAPMQNHQQGVADTYKVVVQHFDSNLNVIDSTTVAIGVIEAVKITASVQPQITFKIIGVGSGTDVCGLSTSVSTSAALVPFGDLLLSTFTQAAQGFSVSTNASGGYSVTAAENDQLGRNGGSCPDGSLPNTDCIPDSTGDAATITEAAAGLWTSTSTKGFGYTLDNKNSLSGLILPFQHDTSTTGTNSGGGTVDDGSTYTCTSNSATGCTGGQLCHCFRQFSDTSNSEGSIIVSKSITPVENSNYYLCYRAVVSTTQAAGYYENYVTYIATANF